MTTPSLSLILICKNEERMIEGCLQSALLISPAIEIIILDSGSTDKTLEIAQKYTKNIYKTDWPGFGIQKNRALSYATGSWVLSLDADERVSEKLAQEIQTMIQLTPAFVSPIRDISAFDIPFESYFFNKKIRFGDWSGEHHIRLFKKSQAVFDQAPVHENLKISGSIQKLQNPILHYSYTHQSQINQKIKTYARAGAEKLRKKGKLGGFYIGLIKASFTFLRGYLFKLGFLDGLAGLQIAWMNTRYTFFKYYWVK